MLVARNASTHPPTANPARPPSTSSTTLACPHAPAPTTPTPQHYSAYLASATVTPAPPIVYAPVAAVIFCLMVRASIARVVPVVIMPI